LTSFISYSDRCPLVAILRGVRPEEVVAIGEALALTGFSIIEVPLNSPQPFDSIRRLAERFGDEVLIGAGTVTDPEKVQEIADAGGRLVVMPHADGRVVTRAKALGLAAVPGFLSPTEGFAMLEAGADGLKLFPAEIAGPTGLKAMRAVLPKAVPVLPVGGITPDSLATWLPAGASGFGLGSALYKPGDDAVTVATRAEAFIAAQARAATAASS